MTWQALVAISILLFSLDTLLHRVLMRDQQSDPYTQTILFYGIGGIFAAVIALARGGLQYQIAPHQIPYFGLLAVFITIGPVLIFKALQRIEASEVSVLRATQRLWIVVGAIVLLGEAVSAQRILGAVIIVLGVSIAQWRGQRLVINQGAAFALLAALSYGIADVAGFYIVRDFDVLSFTAYSALLPVAALLILRPRALRNLPFYFKPAYALNITVVSISDALGTFFAFLAYQVGRNASVIAPLMATQTILSVILAILILRERSHMLNKIVGAVLAVAGVVLVL